MATTTTISGLPVPEGSDANNVPSDMAALAAPLDGTIIRKLSTAGIAALTAPEIPAGTFFWNTTTGQLMVSNGSTVVNYAPAWTTWSPTLTMSAGSPVNWTAAGRYLQVGKLVTATFQITFSSGIGTSTGAVLRLSYPVAPASAAVTLSDYVAGMVWMRDNSETQAWQGGIRLATTSYMHFALISSFQSVSVADNVPCGWSTSDSIVGQLTYEAA